MFFFLVGTSSSPLGPRPSTDQLSSLVVSMGSTDYLLVELIIRSPLVAKRERREPANPPDRPHQRKGNCDERVASRVGPSTTTVAPRHGGTRIRGPLDRVSDPPEAYGVNPRGLHYLGPGRRRTDVDGAPMKHTHARSPMPRVGSRLVLGPASRSDSQTRAPGPRHGRNSLGISGGSSLRRTASEGHGGRLTRLTSTGSTRLCAESQSQPTQQPLTD